MLTQETLPCEIWDQIFSLLEKPSICATLATSWSLCDLATPRLYEDVTFSWCMPVGIGRLKPPSPSPPPVQLLLRSLLNNPGLSSHVKVLNLCGNPIWDWTADTFFHNHERRSDNAYKDVQWPEPLLNSESFTADEWKRLTTNITEIEMHFALRRTIQKEPEHNALSLRSTINMLLACMTSVTRLRLDSSFFKISDADIILSKGIHKNLCEAEFDWDIKQMWEATLPTNQPLYLSGLLALPKMRTLSAALGPKCPSLNSLSPSTTCLNSLVLHHSRLLDEEVGKLLRVTPHLSSLELHFWIDPPEARTLGRTGSHLFDIEQLGESLTYCRESLTRLIISIRFIVHSNGFDWEEQNTFRATTGQLKTLKTFSKLSVLEVPYMLLLGPCQDENHSGDLVDVVPMTLEDLTLTDHLQEMFPYYKWLDLSVIVHLLKFIPVYGRNSQALSKGNTPLFLLKIVRAWEGLRQRRNPWKQEVLRDLRLFCKKHGVLGLTSRRWESTRFDDDWRDIW